MKLEPCPACQRHVRADERVCPFCAADLTTMVHRPPRRPMPGERLGRAALMSLSLSAGALGACEQGVPVYGAPSPPDEDHEGQDATVKDAGPRDASVRDASDAALDARVPDAGDAQVDAAPLDAGQDAGEPGVFPVYGAPVQRPKL
jgi:hypothetical protein